MKKQKIIKEDYLEKNNGWINIAERGLPKGNLEYKVGTLVGGKFYRSSGVYDMFEVTISFTEGRITHYHALEELDAPLY